MFDKKNKNMHSELRDISSDRHPTAPIASAYDG